MLVESVIKESASTPTEMDGAFYIRGNLTNMFVEWVIKKNQQRWMRPDIVGDVSHC